MQIIVLGDKVSRENIKTKNKNAAVQIICADTPAEISNYTFAEAVFILNEEINMAEINACIDKPVFINSTLNTLKELQLPKNISRINGWPTFLQRETWEIASNDDTIVKNIYEKLEWKYISVADEPGLVSARIISMIINEAYFALDDNVSSKAEIDLAMKLGTNYPYGPFEWGKKIGLQKIYSLLKILSETDSRYNVAPALKNELHNLQWH